MLNKMLKVAITLSAYDKMSGTVKDATKKSENAIKHFKSVAKANLMSAAGSFGGAGGLALTAEPVIEAFSNLEDASIKLKSVMLREGNQIDEKMFGKVNAEAIRLGNKLPGTTADFQTLFAVMQETGVKAQSILNGSGQAAAYLAVQMELPTEEAGKLAGKLQNAMTIPDKQMMEWMDFMARMKNVNVEATEMQYAFAKAAMPMKMLGIQGLKAGKIVGNFFAQAISTGQSGETIGTNFGRILSEVANPAKYKAFQEAAKQYGISVDLFDKKGQFKGIENFMTQFYQFQGMDPLKINEILAPLTGGEGVDSGLLSMLSMDGANAFNAMNKRLSEQANLTDKVNLRLTSFRNMWESTKGTFENFLASVGQAFAPEMKSVVEWLGRASAKMQEFSANHPTLFKIAAGLTFIGIGLLSIMGTLSLLRGAWALMAASSIASIAGIQFALFSLRYHLKFSLWPAIVAAWTATSGWAATTWAALVPALGAATTASWAFVASLLANPITWIVLAVVALGAAFYVAYQKSETFRAVLAGLLAVGKLLLDVFIGLGKIAIGAVTMDMSMIKEGAAQAAKAQLSIMTGGVARAFAQGYKESLASDKAKAAAESATPAPGPKPMPVANNSGSTNLTFAPIVNLQGSATKADGDNLNKGMKTEFDKLMKNYKQQEKRTSF